MSSINSVGSSLYSFFKSVQSADPTTAPQATSATSAATATDPSTTTASTDSGQAVQGAGHHHHHGGKFKQIVDAVTSALQSAAQDAPADGTSTDVNKTIQDAIASVLKGGGAGKSGGTDQPDAAEPTPTPEIDATGEAAPGTSSIQNFFQQLNAAGVDPQQFRQDFLSALQSVNGGQSDPTSNSDLLLPPGSVVDVAA